MSGHGRLCTPGWPGSSLSNHALTCADTYRMRMPEIARAITRRWISLVPSKMV
jgi:hypothetical protein